MVGNGCNGRSFILLIIYPHYDVSIVSFLFQRGPFRASPNEIRQSGQLCRFTSNVGVTPLTDRHGWNKDAFPCTVM